MEEMKSALERALERANRLGKLSPEEMLAKKKAELMPIGEGIARRFFEHGRTDILAEQIDRYTGDEKEIVRKATLNALVDGINLDNRAWAERALQGITSIGENDSIEAISADILRLFGQYAWQKKLWYEENADIVGKKVRERLAEAGISGSAIGEINIETSEVWQEESHRIADECDAELSALKKSIAEVLGLP